MLVIIRLIDYKLRKYIKLYKYDLDILRSISEIRTKDKLIKM